jgi:gluconate kinase
LLRERIEARRHPYMNKELLNSQLAILEEPADGITVDISTTPEIVVESIIKNLTR